ncbi:MAG: hypothetical protein JXR23_06280 [Pontiellaceae bacterium]|nr:hypothetical protein [Pontiellaceae bacterium]
MKKINKSKDAFVLLIALAFVSLLALGSTFLLRVSLQKAYTENKRAYTEMARIIAESGVHISVSSIQRDAAGLVSGFDPIEIGDGTATIVIEESGDASLSSTDSSEKYYDLTSTGTWGSQTSTVGVLLRATSVSGSEDSGEEEYFDGSVFCDKTLEMVGAASVDVGGGGSVHANGVISLKGSASFKNANLVSSSTGIDMSGGNAKIVGSALAPTISLPNWAQWQAPDYFITGGVVEGGVERKEVWIDTEPYKVLAEANDISGSNYGNIGGGGYTFSDSYISEGELKNGSKGVSFGGGGGVIAPVGGVLWIEGDVTFGGSCTVKGCVIATGTINVQGGMTHESVNTKFPSFMSLNGDVNIGSGCIVYGLVYADQGNIDVSGAATVHGAYIARNGSFSNKGSGSVIARGVLPAGPNGENVMHWGGTGSSSGGGNSSGRVEVVRWFK